MLSDFLANNIKSQAGVEAGGYVTYGYGQVEPNHLSAQRTGQIYAQLPANKDINVLENGQFVKYDYMNEEVNFTGIGEWMLVFNEIKLYREHQMDCEFAMKRGDYVARVYSPVAADTNFDAQSRWYGGKDAEKVSYSQLNRLKAEVSKYLGKPVIINVVEVANFLNNKVFDEFNTFFGNISVNNPVLFWLKQD